MKKTFSKAQLSMSFNWIFVIIVGVVFLVFFFSLISSQTKSSEQKVSATVAKQFQTILGTTSQKPGTFKTYRTSPIEVEFVCEGRESLSYYAVSGTQAGRTTHDVLFAPPRIQGTEIYTWTQEWSYPYRVMNFLYVTNKFQMFVFYTGDGPIIPSVVKKLTKDFPTNVTTYYMNSTHQPKPYLNNDLYTYVFFTEQINDLMIYLDEDYVPDNSVFIIIKPDSNIFDSGKVYFLSKEDYFDKVTSDVSLEGLDSSDYFGAASLYGAIFSSDQDFYDCNMEKAFRRLHMISLLQEYRIESEIKDISPTSNCNYLFNGSTTLPNGLRQLVSNYTNISSSGFMNLEKDVFIDVKKQIEDKNQRIAFEAMCPVLY